MDETIYNLLNRIPQCPPASSIDPKIPYQSTYAANVRKNFNKNKHSHRTMGPAIVCKPNPSQPLRRREKYVELPKLTPFIRSHKIPSIPKVNEQNPMNSYSSKNFIQENITKMINSSPKTPRRFVVSDRNGNKFLIDGSGLQKDFIYKKTYGRIPQYIRTRKISSQPLITEKSEDSSKVLLTADERLRLISDLKQRHSEIFAEYQRLPLRIETISKIAKEALLLSQLKSLECDLEFLEKHENIFTELKNE